MLSTTLSVNKAFTRQSFHYDEEDLRNPVLQRMRAQVYSHTAQYLKPQSRILELNAGTGIDALHFVNQGHTVHATDLSDGMIAQLKAKMKFQNLEGRLSVQQVSYENLDVVNQVNFDFVFSNFGGLNCVDDLSKVTKNLKPLLKPHAYITLVIMPVVCPWEIVGIVAHGKKALRRFTRGGVQAHLEGEYFQTYYHSLKSIKKAFDKDFTFLKTEGLASISPQPHRGDFPVQHPTFYKALVWTDSNVKNHFPFNRWADHIIVTFQYTPDARA